MSASITPFGTSRSVYSFANSDIEINGNVNANQFIGDGQNITNINIDNINNANVNFNKKLIKNIGGTGNSTYIDKGIVFNNNSTDKFDTTSNLYWDYNENILYINKKNIVETFSSYTDKSSNSIIETIKNTSNNIIKEIKNTIQSNIFIENVQGIPKGSKTNYGIYKVGEGIFVNNGVLSIAPAPIVIKEPSVEPKLIPSIIEDTTYEKFIFKYDPNRGTTFEVNDNSILQYHFNFNEITDVNNIKSIGIQKNNIIINNITNVFLEPTINKKYEYTPLDNNYLYFDGELNSFAQFDSNFNMYNIYSVNLIEGGPEIGITFSFWFKTHSFIHVDKFLFSFSNSNINTYRFEIKIIKSGEFNHLAVNIRQGTDNEHIISDVKIYINTWYHFVWTIDGNQYPTWGLYVNYQNNPNQIYEKLLFNRIGIAINSDYSIKNIGKATHKSNTNLRFSISDIRIYNKVLNKTDITELYKLDEYTQYKISFNDPNYTTCDILLIGGGGGGTNEGGGGAGELIFIDNAIFEEKEYVIKVGRGGAGRVTEIINGNNTILQKNTKGINTVFGNIIVNGGGSASVLSGKGGSGSGNGGTLKLNTNVNDFNYRKIYFKGNDGYQINGGGGGSGSIGKIYDGGDGIGTIEDIINNTTYNFGELFDLLNDDDIGYYDANSDLIFFAGGGGSNINNSYGGLGGGGDGSSDYIENINYKGRKNTGSGGGGYNDHGYSGGSGIVILRYLQTEIISSGIGNQLIITSNNLLSKINALTTDNIIQQNNNNKKFIIDNVYDNDLLLNGSLTINSNLIIHGETTIFNTDIYISEKVNISNYDSDTALHVKQFGNILPDFNNIFIIDYNESRLFTISDNGNVGVGVLPQLHNLLDVKGNINIVSQINKDFKFTINNRDIIRDTSNYTSRTSNILISDYNTKFQYASNYILENSNFHRIDYDTKFKYASNYILENSNFHRIDYDTKFQDASNYILETSNFHRIDYDTKFQDASNYILETSNFHRIDYDTKFNDASNYILETSNVISSIITNLNADSIADGIINKFIINNKYKNDLEIIGNLKATNLIIYGENTYLYTDIYTTEQLSVENNGLGTAFNVKQLNSSYSIFNASNSETEVFTILNEGNVGIGGIIPSGNNLLEVRGNVNIISHLNEKFKFTINNRDIIRETSNYILETSNFHRIDYDTKFQYASNYILETSNLISSIITYLTTDNIADGNTNKFIVSGKYDGNIEIKGDLITSNITIIGEKTSLVNNIFKTEVLELSNNGIDTAIKVIQLNPTYDIFNAYNNTENVFTILGNGNIGIGEKNPLVKLEINGDVNIYSNLYVNGTETIINTKLKAKNILIENNTLEKALTIKQSIGNDILSVSNINREVLTIKNDGRIGINNASPENTLDVYGNINATSYTHNGYPLSLGFSQGMIIQTKHLTYSKTEIKNGNDWEPINNDINNGFVIAIKPSDITSKILISTVCHIGMEYETDSRWWGIRLYRKIGNGTWTHISNANGIIDNNENGTSCWISHNLGADSSTYSHFITNITGSYQDTPNTTEIVYYTAYWKNRVGELSDGLLYLNKSSYTLDNNYPRPSSSWTATEIWNKGVSYIAPLQSTQIQINTQYNSVGIDTSPPTEVHKLKVNGSINIIDGTYNMNGYDIMQNISNFILNTSNILIQKINELLNRIELLENN